MRKMVVNGEVNCIRINAGGNFECDGSRLANVDDVAFQMEGGRVAGDIYLRNGFTSNGEVCMYGATVDGQLDCGKGHFLNKGKMALRLESLKVGLNVSFTSGFEVDGVIDLMNATITGDLRCLGILNPQNMALALFWAKIGTIVDEPDSWPPTEYLFLDGLRYDRFASVSTPNDSQLPR